MKVFLTGGTGFVGQEILRQLHLEEHSVRMLVRDAGSMRAKAAVAEYGAELTVGDILETHQAEKQSPHPLRRRAFGGQAGPLPFRRGEGEFSARSRASALTGVQAVIHLVGIISEVSRSTFENVHTQGTRNVVAAAQAAGVKRFIHMSALGTRLHASSRYHQTKWAAEEAVRASGLDYTIFRPSLIYGPQDQFVNLFAKIIRRSPIVPVLGSPRARFQPVSIDAVASAFVKSLNESKSVGQTYDLCGPETFTLPEILDQIMQAIGRKRLKLRVPNGLARCQAVFLEFLFPRLLRKAAPLNRDQLTMLQEDNIGDAGPANDLFNLQHPQFREGIARYVRREA